MTPATLYIVESHSTGHTWLQLSLNRSYQDYTVTPPYPPIKAWYHHVKLLRVSNNIIAFGDQGGSCCGQTELCRGTIASFGRLPVITTIVYSSSPTPAGTYRSPICYYNPWEVDGVCVKRPTPALLSALLIPI